MAFVLVQRSASRHVQGVLHFVRLDTLDTFATVGGLEDSDPYAYECGSTAPIPLPGYFRIAQASTSGNVGVINLLLKKGADVSVTDKDGVTTLMSAASHGHAQVGAIRPLCPMVFLVVCKTLASLLRSCPQGARVFALKRLLCDDYLTRLAKCSWTLELL